MLPTISPRSLGQRIRQLRTRKDLTQQDLAGEDYSKSYISAIEQGKTRPSLEALQRIAARLQVAAGTLLDPDAPGFMPADPESMPRRVRRRRGVRSGIVGAGVFDPAQQDLQLARAEIYIYSGQAAQALEILRSMLPDDAGSLASQAAQTTSSTPRTPGTPGTPGTHIERPLDQNQLQKAYYLISLAGVQSGNASEAIDYLQKGMQLAARTGDREALEHFRLVLGTAYYHSGQPLSALEQHRLCLEATKSGAVRDPNFKLRVLSNMVADYRALRDNEHTLEAYKQSLHLLDELSSVERQAAIFWEVSTNYSAERQYDQAKKAAAKAISIYQALDNIQTVARMESHYGDLLVEAGELDQAQEYLQRGLELGQGIGSEMGNPLDRAEALTSLARLSLRRNELNEAGRQIAQAVETSREAMSSEAGKISADHLQSQAGEVLAGALTLLGEIATQMGDAKGGDEAFGEAIKLLERGIAAGSASDIYRRYAKVLASQGEHERASDYFELAYEAVTHRGR